MERMRRYSTIRIQNFKMQLHTWQGLMIKKSMKNWLWIGHNVMPWRKIEGGKEEKKKRIFYFQSALSLSWEFIALTFLKYKPHLRWEKLFDEAELYICTNIRRFKNYVSYCISIQQFSSCLYRQKYYILCYCIYA